jgi:putative hydrolase
VYCKQCHEIDRVQRQHPQIRLLKGAAVDILDDGTLDLDDATLQELDLVVISVHSKLTMDRKAMNRRVVRALRHPPQASRGVHADIPARVPRQRRLEAAVAHALDLTSSTSISTSSVRAVAAGPLRHAAAAAAATVCGASVSLRDWFHP